MNTTLHLPSTPWLPFGWLRGLLRPRAPTHRLDAESADLLDALARLDSRVLRDIGAPERLLARAIARRDAQRLHDDPTLELGAAAWRHW